MKNKKTIILLLLIAIVGVVGLTLAYFANTANVDNEFKTKQYGTTVEEVFESPSDWTPGTTTPKTLTVTNSGQVDEAVRVSYTESWTSANSNVEGDLSLTQGDNRAAIINLTNVSDWTPVEESDNKTYYYYNYKLVPGETTSTLLESVTFNSAITNSSNCSTSETATGKTVTCTSTGDGYDGATYKLVFKVETVQYDKYADAWNTNASIANTSKPAPVVAQTGVPKLLSTATNASTVTSYNDASADKGKMFEFTHTLNGNSVTDYRYIGNVPNNYVYFNCTDDSDTATCETWRIIGVFSVERTDPEDATKTITETRMKIVRGSDFATTMKWDDRTSEDTNGNPWGKNDWNGSYMNTYLNGDYYNSLSATAKSQIDNAIYYLGGRTFDSTTHYGTTEEIYTWERENLVYNNTRPTSWEGKVGLMYPSDMYMTYGKGVDNTCYNDPYNCSEYDDWGPRLPKTENIGYPTTGWIHNTNKLEGSTPQQWTWFLSPCSGYSDSVFGARRSGFLEGNRASSTGGVRPVVYLKSDIKIVSGTGEVGNPYVLK